MLEAEGVGLVEFSYKYWGPIPPNTYINGTILIDTGYRSPDIEVTNFCMLLSINSPGNYRAWTIEASTKSVIGEHLHKIERLCGRRLVMSNHKAVKRYNEIVKEQVDIHNIKKRFDAVDKLTRICGRLGPKWLESMIIKLYEQMDETIVHAQSKC